VTEHLQMARLIKPFPTRRLADGLYQVEAGGNLIHQRLISVLRDPPGTPESWCMELQQLKGLLLVLADECHEAVARVDGFYDRADEDFASSVRAIRLMGLGFAAEVPVTEAEDESFREAA
jgi:hypothetical protein